MIRKLTTAIKNAGTSVVQKVHNQTGYILSTTKEERKAARKQKRRGIRQSISQWKPFGFLGRNLKKERKEDFGVSNPVTE